MAATGKTPILLYGSTTATNTPTAGNLTNSSDGCEIAINVADKNLFFKDSTNAVNTVPIRQSSASSNGWLSSTDWSTFNSKQPAGTYVTSVTGTAPVVSSGGTTPAISMAAATGSVNGYLTSTDWTTFNNKQAALVSGTNIKTVNGTTLLGSGDVGTIDVAHGGTGLTAVTAGYIPFGSTSTALKTSANGFFWDETNVRLGIYNTAPATALDVYGTIRSTRRGATSQYVDLFPTSGGTSLNVSAGSGALNISTNGGSTNMLAVDGVGNVTVGAGNLVIGTSGKGIDFSATAGTGTSELLADYEEGTWTPVLSDGTNNATMDAGAIGTYTKIGRAVYITCTVYTSSLGSVSGNIRVTGLPYTANISFSPAAIASSGNQLLSVTAGQYTSGRVLGGTTYIELWLTNTAAGMSRMQATEWSADGYANFAGCYFV